MERIAQMHRDRVVGIEQCSNHLHYRINLAKYKERTVKPT